MIPPSHLYPWLDLTPARQPRRRRFRAGPNLLASVVAGGVSGAVAALLVALV